MMVDIDFFKKINDTCMAMMAVMSCLNRWPLAFKMPAIRGHDIAARPGE
jgi:PleD family two-component response regulator